MHTDKLYTVYEYDDITCDDIGDTAFKQLRTLILPNNADNEQSDLVIDASVCMNLYARGGREVIRVKNYVGIISLQCGVTIEVLPKIRNDDKSASRRMVIEMLKACEKIPYKHFQNADLHADKFTLREIFIRLFIDSVDALYKKGLSAGYVYTESNDRFIKGKLLVNQNIKYNYAHGERFFVGYDEFSFNRAENRLIKSTLLYLRDKSEYEENKRDLRRLCFIFDEVRSSENIELDFANCDSDRNVKYYADVLKLCRVFLRKKSFTLYGGRNEATALLFPMEKLFERFVAREMEKALPYGWRLTPQSKNKYLFDNEKFLLCPDIVLHKPDRKKIIVDTKWKMLSPSSDKNHGISQADMYQMYAYHTRFDHVEKVILLYPYYTDIHIADFTAAGDSKRRPVTVRVKFFDLEQYIRSHDFADCCK